MLVQQKGIGMNFNVLSQSLHTAKSTVCTKVQSIYQPGYLTVILNGDPFTWLSMNLKGKRAK